MSQGQLSHTTIDMCPFHNTTDDDTRPSAGATPGPSTTVEADDAEIYPFIDVHLSSGDEDVPLIDHGDISSDDEVVYVSSDEQHLEDVKNCIRIDEYEYHVLPCIVADKSHVCTICLDQLRVGDIQHQLGCGHGFHPRCIKPWLTTQCTCPLCPNCRYDVRTGNVFKVLDDGAEREYLSFLTINL